MSSCTLMFRAFNAMLISHWSIVLNVKLGSLSRPINLLLDSMLLHIKSLVTLSGILNIECVVLPFRNHKDAKPLEHI